MIEPKQPRKVPVWISSLVIVLALAAGAGLVYCFFTHGPGGADAVVLDRGPEDGIKPLPGGRTWTVISGNTKMKVVKLPGDKLQATFGYLQYDFLAPAEFDVLNKGRRIAADSAMAEAIGLAQDQADKLKEQVRRGFDIGIPEDAQKKVVDLFRDWMDAAPASRAGPELKVLHTLDELGEQNAAVARKQTTDALAQIQQIVTPQQWQKFDSLQ